MKDFNSQSILKRLVSFESFFETHAVLEIFFYKFFPNFKFEDQLTFLQQHLQVLVNTEQILTVFDFWWENLGGSSQKMLL